MNPPPLKKRFAQWERYADIVRFKTYANLKRDIDKTYLGSLWWVLEPMLGTAVFYVLFSHGLRSALPHVGSGASLVLFFLIGNIVYGHFSASVNGGASAILSNAGLIQQTQLPKALYPIIAICNLTWKFLFSLVVMIPVLFLLHAPLSLSLLALPLLLLLQIATVTCLSLPLSILIPYFQDGKTLLATFLNLLMWISVILTADRVPPQWLWLFHLNPAATLIEGFRSVLMLGQWPAWGHFVLPLLLCAAVGALGVALTERLKGKVTKLPL